MSVKFWMNCCLWLQWPTLEARMEQSSLAFWHKIHIGVGDTDKVKYLTPAPALRQTTALRDFQYRRYFRIPMPSNIHFS